MRNLRTLLIISILALVLASGCVNRRTVEYVDRIVYVADGDPVQLAEPVEARVRVRLEDGSEAVVDDFVIPEGWYALPRDKPE